MQAKLLTQEQLAAIISFACDNGRNWKTELRHSWLTCNYAGRNDGHLLQQIRNQFGPTWLVSFDLKAAQAAQQVEANKLAGQRNWETCHTILSQDQEIVLLPEIKGWDYV